MTDGGPAFPQNRDNKYTLEDGRLPVPGGMNLRDWFAGQFVSNVQLPWPGDHTGRHWSARVAEDAYKLADSMLAAREKKE